MYINFLHVLFYRDQIQPELRFMFVFLPGSLKKTKKTPRDVKIWALIGQPRCHSLMRACSERTYWGGSLHHPEQNQPRRENVLSA